MMRSTSSSSSVRPYHEALPAISRQLDLCNPKRAGVALSLADSLFKRWSLEAEREETWAKLQKCISDLGPACQWDLPARLRLVAVVVQVTEVLDKVHVPVLVGLWILRVRRQKQAQKFDALGLMGDLSKCLECSESIPLTEQEKADLALLSSERLELNVVAAASTVSSHLDYYYLEDRLIHAIRSKEFKLAQAITHELELLWKFLQISVPKSEPAPSDPSGLLPANGDDDTLRDLLELSQDDTLEDMLELGGEGEDLEEVATPISQTSQQLRQVGPLLIGKRKAEVIGSIEVPKDSVRRRQVPASQSFFVPSQSQIVPVSPSSMSQGSRVSDLFTSALSERREDRMFWTPEEEQKLIAGHTAYGNRWGFLRVQCGLQNKTGAQLKDKVRNLKKNGDL